MGHGRLVVAIAGMLLISACGEKKPKSGWGSFPVPIYADSSVTQNPDRLADFKDAIEYWHASAGQALFDFKGEWSGGAPYSGSPNAPDAIFANVFFYMNPWPFSNNTVGMTTVRSGLDGFEGALVMINGETEFCSGDCTFEAGFSARKTYAHELGHFLGIGHTDDPSSIMYPSTTPGAELNIQSSDTAAVKALLD